MLTLRTCVKVDLQKWSWVTTVWQVTGLRSRSWTRRRLAKTCQEFVQRLQLWSSCLISMSASCIRSTRRTTSSTWSSRCCGYDVSSVSASQCCYCHWSLCFVLFSGLNSQDSLVQCPRIPKETLGQCHNKIFAGRISIQPVKPFATSMGYVNSRCQNDFKSAGPERPAQSTRNFFRCLHFSVVPLWWENMPWGSVLTVLGLVVLLLVYSGESNYCKLLWNRHYMHQLTVS